MNPITFTIESVHGLKQTLTLDTFVVGPAPKSPPPKSDASADGPDPTSRPVAAGRPSSAGSFEQS